MVPFFATENFACLLTKNSAAVIASEHLTHGQKATAEQPKQLTGAHRERSDTETFKRKKSGVTLTGIFFIPYFSGEK